jgi:hypothetical protein
MKQLVPSRRFLVIAILMASVMAPLGLIYPQASAQSDTTANAADGLQISPALIELNGDAGKTYNVDLKVQNVTASDLIFNSSVNDFASKNETGTPNILLDETNPSPTSIQSWVSNIPSFTLAARQTKTINATITIPSDAEPGGHYGVIRFSGSTPTLTGTSVGLTASAGTLILVKVSGVINEKLDLITFEATSNNKPSSLFESGQITFLTRFQNTGSIHLKPVGQVIIHDAFGGTVATLPVNAEKGNVLPASIRRFTEDLNKQWMFGLYKADIAISYGTTGQAIVQTISFWVIPYKLILVGLIVLITLIFVLRTLIKRYNSYIVAKTNKQAHNNVNKKSTKKH